MSVENPLKTPKKSFNGRINRPAALVFLLFLAISPYAQEPPSPAPEDAAPPAKPAEEKPAETIRSLGEERRDTIKYGLEPELIDLLAALRNEKNDGFIGDFAEVLAQRPGVKTVQEIFAYFTVMDSDAGMEAAEKYLENYQEEPRDIVGAVLRYLSAEKNHDVQEQIYPLLDSPVIQIAKAAVRYFGKKGNAESAEKLLGLFGKQDISRDLREDIVLALGEMKAEGAVAFLISLLEDEDEDMTLRRYACDSLGKIGDSQALPAIKAALGSPDNLLRSFAISSLGYFPGDENAGVLTAALRDSFPRVRELAAERLGDMGYEEAVDILIYRARRDPDRKVRQAAFRSLSKIGSSEAVAFLQEFLEGERNALDLRSLAAEELADRHPDAMAESAAKVMAMEWTKDRSPMLDVVCKLLSQKEYSGFGDLYKRMLGHANFIIQIYGVRGVQKNRVTGLKAEVEALSAEGRHPQLRKNALSALEGL
ncbi:MAG: HEAT repeat domain-containing protein [Spirochaetia bacterium]|jgi:HEAT repeat protein|nr:HEAT repeat domain-containing protein [Spirochaetia bacterium]